MATKKRLIYVEDALAGLQYISRFGDVNDTMMQGAMRLARSKIENTPTVDAVEVVRCKECRQWCRNIGIADSPNGHCFCHDIETNGCDFCSYGERKDNG